MLIPENHAVSFQLHISIAARQVKKSNPPPPSTFAHISACSHPTQTKICCLPLITSAMYQFRSNYLNICENATLFVNINSLLLAVHFSLLQYSQTFSETNSLHLWNYIAKMFYHVSNCYVSDHILYSKFPPVADTLNSSTLGKSFTPMNFCSTAIQICCSASFNSETVLGTAWCSWL